MEYNTMKVRRNLSGVFFRSKNEETGKFDNVVFEDLSEEEQNKFMEGRNEEWLRHMVKIMANTINEIGEETGIAKE